VKSRKAPWKMIMLLAFLAFLFGITAAASASAATSTGWLRLGNLSPNISPVDVYVYPSGSSAATIMLHDVVYGEVSGNLVVNTGGYTVKMLTTGSPASSKPVLTASVTVQAGHSYTVAALSVSNSGRQAMVLDDSLTTPAGKTLVRVVQASLSQGVVKFFCSCGGFLNPDGTPGPATPYKSGAVGDYNAIPPGPNSGWTMTVTGSTAKATRFVPLTAGSVHTEIVLQNSGGGITIIDLLDASATNQPPLGGVETGFGGTAHRGHGSPLPWTAVIGAGVLLILAGGLALRKPIRRSTAGI
jgi:hypothetical protein